MFCTDKSIEKVLKIVTQQINDKYSDISIKLIKWCYDIEVRIYSTNDNFNFHVSNLPIKREWFNKIWVNKNKAISDLKCVITNVIETNSEVFEYRSKLKFIDAFEDSIDDPELMFNCLNTTSTTGVYAWEGVTAEMFAIYYGKVVKDKPHAGEYYDYIINQFRDKKSNYLEMIYVYDNWLRNKNNEEMEQIKHDKLVNKYSEIINKVKTDIGPVEEGN